MKKIQTSVGGVSDLQKKSLDQVSGRQGLNEKLSSIGELNRHAVETNKTLGSILSDAKNSGIDNLIARLHHTAGLAFKAAGELNRLTAAVDGYNKSVGAAQNMKLTRVVDSSGEPFFKERRGSSKMETENQISEFFFDKSAFFMLRYRLYSSILDAIFYGMVDIGMGRSRSKIADALGELTAVAFTGAQKKQAEFAANVFSMKLWNVTTEEYLNALSATASAFDVNNIGFENMKRMNEAALRFGKLSKLSAEKSADLMTGIILQLMTRLPSDVNERLKSGLRANVKDYGEVDLGGLSEKIAAQSAKAIQISTVWGPGIAGAFKYMLPELLEKGWSIPAALALLGSIKDAGFPAEQIGRATKETFLSAPADFAKTILWATDRWETEGEGMPKGTAKALNEEKTRILTKTVQEWFADPELFRRNMPLLGEALRLAEKKGALPVEDLGLSKYFMSVTRTLTTAGAMERFREQMQIINRANYDEVSYMAAEMLDDAGTAWARISNSFTRFFQAMADSPIAHSIADPVSQSMDFLTLYSTLPRMLKARGLNHEEALKAFETEYEKPFEAMFGQYLTSELRQGIDKAYGGSWDIMIFPEYFALLDDFLNEQVKSIHSSVKKALPWNWGKDEKDMGYLPFMPKASKALDRLINPFEADWSDAGKFLSGLVEDVYDNMSYVVTEVWAGIKWVYELGGKLVDGIGTLLNWLTETLTWPLSTIYSMITGKGGDKGTSTLSPYVSSVTGLPVDPGMMTFQEQPSIYSRVKDWWNNAETAGETLAKPGLTEGLTDETESLRRKLTDSGIPGTADMNPEAPISTGGEDRVMPPQLPASSWIPMFLQNYPVQPSAGQDTPIQIENRLIVDGRELAYIISEIIQRNRIRNYQSFGSDPFGYDMAI